MTDTYVIDSSGRAVITKDPSAVLDYTFDWTAWLADISDTISTHVVTVETGITLDSSSVTGVNKKVVAWISGGVAGTMYMVSCKIVTAGGRTDERSIFIQVKNR